MDAAELFGSSLGLIERLARAVCRRAGVEGADADDFVSASRLALLEDNYAVLRGYEGRASLATYLTVVFSRLLADERTRSMGRWNVSREAERMGPAGVVLETVVRRDRRSLEEALPFVRAVAPEATPEDLRRMLERLPERTPRPRAVELPENAPALFPAPDRTDERVMGEEARSLAGRAGAVLRETLASFSAEERMLLRFRFVSQTSIADISRMLRMPQRPLYRQMEALLRRLREALGAAGIDALSVRAVIETAVSELDLGDALDDEPEKYGNPPSLPMSPAAEREERR